MARLLGICPVNVDMFLWRFWKKIKNIIDFLLKEVWEIKSKQYVSLQNSFVLTIGSFNRRWERKDLTTFINSMHRKRYSNQTGSKVKKLMKKILIALKKLRR